MIVLLLADVVTEISHDVINYHLETVERGKRGERDILGIRIIPDDLKQKLSTRRRERKEEKRGGKERGEREE